VNTAQAPLFKVKAPCSLIEAKPVQGSRKQAPCSGRAGRMSHQRGCEFRSAFVRLAVAPDPPVLLEASLQALHERALLLRAPTGFVTLAAIRPCFSRLCAAEPLRPPNRGHPVLASLPLLLSGEAPGVPTAIVVRLPATWRA